MDHMNSTTVDYSTAHVMTNLRSYKTRKTAEKWAREWASWNDNQPHDLGEVFETTTWNGGYDIPVWLVYDVSVTDEGFTVTSYRWYLDPRQEG